MRVLEQVYRASLFLYPAEFRREFGPEMSEVFAMQVAEASGLVETARRGWYALNEVFTLALPMRIVDPKLVAPAVSLLGTPAILVPLLWALNNPKTLNLLARNAFGQHH
jgi:hypothetical protein